MSLSAVPEDEEKGPEHLSSTPPATYQQCLTFTHVTNTTTTTKSKSKSKTKSTQTRPTQFTLQNSLLAGVGFLELANSGDFAANVWNQVPPPHFAMGLMALGGTLALSIVYFAVWDFQLSRRNIRVLRAERAYLLGKRRAKIDEPGYEGSNNEMTKMDLLLDVTFRELGSEVVDRIGMDGLMGFGAVLVGVGTFMAIGGANPQVYHASNLLSGYIGNTPSLLYGISNFLWSIFMWRRARRHDAAGASILKNDTVEAALKHRASTVKMHAILNGLAGILGGIAGIISATMWWGYVILLPCILSAIYCNFVWRRRIGYDRPPIKQLEKEIEPSNSLMRDLEFASFAQNEVRRCKEAGSSADVFTKLAPSAPNARLGLAAVGEFLVKFGFFEDFCARLLADTTLSVVLFGSLSNENLFIDSGNLMAAKNQALAPQLFEIAQACVRDTGVAKFRYRERYLLEALGCYLCNARGRLPNVPDLPRKGVESKGEEAEKL